MTLRIGALLVSSLCTGALLACGGEGSETPTETEPQISSVTVSPDSAKLKALGATQNFEATAKDQNGNEVSGIPFSWSVISDSVASIDGNGSATALSNGSTEVEVSASGITDSASLVVEQEPAGVRVTPSISHVQSDGDTTVLEASVEDARGNPLAEQTIQWRSSNSDIADVGSAGVVTGNSVGSATITASMDTVEGTSNAEVYVPVDSVALSPDSMVTVLNASTSFTSQVYDSDGGTPSKTYILWSTSNSDAADIDTSGTALASSPDTLKVIASSFGEADSATLVIPPALRFADVAVGRRYTCGITLSNLVYCWGERSSALGTQLAASRQSSPIPVSFEFESTLISADLHTCTLSSDGKAYCWGNNDSGQLGIGLSPSTWEPTQVNGGYTFSTLDAEGSATCALTPSDEPYCWGYNGFGQLGTGDYDNRTEPTAVEGGHTFTDIEVGAHTCAVSTSGDAYCWGDNEYGQLGVDTAQKITSPIQVKTDLTFKTITTGKEDFTCGVTEDGTGYCWGHGNWNQLGNGFSQTTAPREVQGGHEFIDISAGRLHACGLTTDNDIYCWGANNAGQLGTGERVSEDSCDGYYCSTSPSKIDSDRKFDHLSAQKKNTCAITVDDKLFCWGRNAYGQVGNGVAEPGSFESSPVRVLGQNF